MYLYSSISITIRGKEMGIIIRKNDEFTTLLQNKLKERYEQRRRLDNKVHVSDIIPTSCIRKQYYARKYPELDVISNETVQHFVRGEASELVITSLADLGVSQSELEMDGLTGRPDIMNSDIIVELKDTMNTQRLNVTDDKFKSYLRQLLYYLVITGIEKGIISIKYNVKELKWIKSDSNGDYFFRPFNSKSPEIESWEIFLPSNDITREILKNEMIRRKNLFLKALENKDVTILPRLSEKIRDRKCPWCKFYEICMDSKNDETKEANEMVNEIDIFDIPGVIDLKINKTNTSMT
jgi:CRISPR/Cas system-associated exonuclease Cas4 (RecB family)